MPTEAHFDLGIDSSPVETDYTQVTESSIYSVSTGYGWTSTAGLVSRDRTLPDDLTRDLVQSTSEHIFSVDLANGDYLVTVTVGDQSYLHDLIDVYAEDALKINDVTATSGSFPEVLFVVTVADGQLNLRILDDGGVDPNWVINALTIIQNI